MFVEEVVILLQENPHRSAGRCEKIENVGEDILRGYRIGFGIIEFDSCVEKLIDN